MIVSSSRLDGDATEKDFYLYWDGIRISWRAFVAILVSAVLFVSFKLYMDAPPKWDLAELRVTATVPLTGPHDKQANAIAKLALVTSIEDTLWKCVKPGSRSHKLGTVKVRARRAESRTGTYTDLSRLFPTRADFERIKHYYRNAKASWMAESASSTDAVRDIGEARGKLLVFAASQRIFETGQESWRSDRINTGSRTFQYNLVRSHLTSKLPFRGECIAINDAYAPLFLGGIGGHPHSNKPAKSPWLPGEDAWHALKAGARDTSSSQVDDPASGLRL